MKGEGGRVSGSLYKEVPCRGELGLGCSLYSQDPCPGGDSCVVSRQLYHE